MDEALTISIEEAPGLPDIYEIIDGEAVPVTQDETSVAQQDFGENLAANMSETDLSKIADDVLRKVELDIESRKPWMDRFKRGLELMGLHQSEMDDGPFPGASTAVHPLLAEAMVQFWARALPEMMPSDGPVKVKPVGQKTPEKEARAQRVEDYLNYDMMIVDEGYYAEKSRALMATAYQGCSFVKTFRDTVYDRNCGQFVPAEDLIAPYGASTLKASPRFTHRMRLTRNEVRKRQASGLWRMCELMAPSLDAMEEDEALALKAEATDIELSQDDADDARHLIFETYIEYDLPDHPDLNAKGEKTGIELPYIITVDKSSQKVLSIYRNWRDDDPMKERQVYFVKYGYIPGFGIYDLGLFHLIGGLSEAATGALRVILDGSATASLQGGFKTKEGKKLGDGRMTIEPGVWKATDVSAEDMSKAFYTPPFKEPSAVLFNMLGFLVEAGQRFSSITETLTGDADSRSPVGTTVALIEQGSKVFSAIHRGLHNAAQQEYKQRYELARRFMPEGGYPYEIDGDEREVYKADFGPGIAVVPVSDPNIFSHTQRISLAQAAYQLSGENPGIMDRAITVRNLLEALKVPGVDQIMVDNTATSPLDPVSENQAFLLGKPAKVFPDQDHDAHIAVHMAFLQHPGFGGNPDAQQVLIPVMKAHLAEHMAALYAQRMRQIGVPAQMINVSAKGGEDMVPPMEPGQAEDIGRMAAQAVAQFMSAPGFPVPQPPPEEQPRPDPAEIKGMQAIKLGEETHAQKLRHKEDEHKLKIILTADQAKKQGEQEIEAAVRNMRGKDRARDEATLDRMLDELTAGGAPN